MKLIMDILGINLIGVIVTWISVINTIMWLRWRFKRYIKKINKIQMKKKVIFNPQNNKVELDDWEKSFWFSYKNIIFYIKIPRGFSDERKELKENLIEQINNETIKIKYYDKNKKEIVTKLLNFTFVPEGLSWIDKSTNLSSYEKNIAKWNICSEAWINQNILKRMVQNLKTNFKHLKFS